MKDLKFKFPLKKEFIVIFAGILISFIVAKNNLNKFDNNIENSRNFPSHQMIKSDIGFAWKIAEEFRFKLSNGNSFFESLPLYQRTFLHPIIVGYYYHLLGKDIYEKNENSINIIKVKNYKIGILIIQIFAYYASIIFLTNKIKKKIGNKFYFITLVFLSLEPSILQWHTSFWSESFYLSMLVILLTLMIDVSKNKIINLLTGILMGLMFAQKAISFLYIIPFIIYYLYVFKKNVVPSIFLLTGFIFFMSLVGYNHYKKTDTFYIMSSGHQYFSYYHYFAHIIRADRLNIDADIAKKNMDIEEKNWRVEKKIFISQDVLNSNPINITKNIEYRNKTFLYEVIQNPLFSIKFFIKKAIVMTIIHPTWSNEVISFDKSSEMAKENPEIYYNKKLKRNAIYSLFIYFFVLIGIIRFILNFYTKEKIENYDKFLILNLLSITYFILIAGMWGNPRYFAPCLINISFFFSYGFVEVKLFINKRIKQFK